MVENFRSFETGPDPFGRSWKVGFLWQQNAISIRHADTIDTKWTLECEGERSEKVAALPLPALMSVVRRHHREITDSWCMKLGGLHLIHMIASWEDMDKELVTVNEDELEIYTKQMDDAVRDAV